MKASHSRKPLLKLLAALGCLGALALAGTRGEGLAWAARCLLGLLAAGALGYWRVRRPSLQSGFALPQRLRVVSRVGLAQRCAAALLQADGQLFLVIHGEGFAEICPAPVQRISFARRPPPTSLSAGTRRRKQAIQ